MHIALPNSGRNEFRIDIFDRKFCIGIGRFELALGAIHEFLTEKPTGFICNGWGFEFYKDC